MGKLEIQNAIKAFETENLTKATTLLLKSIGLESSRQMPLQKKTYDDFASQYISGNNSFNESKAIVRNWKYVDFLFQITDNEVKFDSSASTVDQAASSYLFFCLELDDPWNPDRPEYSRTALSQITREINKLFLIPALIVFRTGDNLTLSIINRRLHKRDDNKDVLEKVTLIKDINIKSTHRAHIDILSDLSLAELKKKNYVLNSFSDLHKAWQKVLDTKELNKKFYKELSEWYYWAMGEVYFPVKRAQSVMQITKGNWKAFPEVRETNAQHLIRLLTRVLFVWFIKEMNLVSEEFFNENSLSSLLKSFDKDSVDSDYYKAILQNLFFATLNQEITKRKFRTPGYKGRGIANQWRYESTFADKKTFIELTRKTPFLNGGLFECLDKLEYKTVDGVEREDKENSERIDWFSEEKGNELEVPNKIFFVESETTDLSEELGDKAKNTTVRGLFRILRDYKFTIAENTPIEEDVALDPELLGNVFENLLASYNPETKTTARKQTGSYYTPKEIVNYMVDESLKLYLKKALQAKTGMSEADINEGLEILFAYTEKEHCFNYDETVVLIEAVDVCKILDPACGSGAFPMGALHKLVYILHKLDINNELWLQRQIQELSVLSDPVQREEAIAKVEESFRSNKLDYGRKLYLIRNCIYGVDIQPVATQISKLRFLISLMVDQKVDGSKPEENYKIQALPNLETKFVAANTLIGLPAQSGQLSWFDSDSVKEIQRKIEQIRADMFSARDIDRKKKLRKQYKELREQLKQELLKGGENQQAAEMIAAWDPYDQNASSPFFDPAWMFGVEDGFDIVIGNPPYGLINKKQNKHTSIMISDEELSYFKSNSLYESARGGMLNIYRLFICSSFNLLKAQGNFCLIFPMAYMCDSSAANLRRFMFSNSRTLYIESFPERDNEKKRVFEAVKMSVCILGIEKSQPKADTSFRLRVNTDRYVDLSTVPSNVYVKDIISIDSVGFTIPVATHREMDLLVKITKNSDRLGNISKCYEGELHLTAYKEYISNTKTDCMLIRGAQVQKYFITNDISQGELLYLKRKEYLANVDTPRSAHHKSKRIMMQRITGVNESIRLKMTLVDAGAFCANSINYILPAEALLSVECLLGMLNSRLLNWFFAKLSTNSNVNTYEVNNLPILVGENQKEIASGVKAILEAKHYDPTADTSKLEAEIDRFVYELYGLTEDEIKIVEEGVRQ